MQSSTTTGLSVALEAITDLDREIKAAEAAIKEKKALRAHYEGLAIEEMQTQRLDGVKASGRQWRIEIEHSINFASGSKSEVLAAARRAGLEDLITIQTSSLKSYLKQRSNDEGRGKDSPWADGTEFAGLVGEYIRPVLRHVSV